MLRTWLRPLLWRLRQSLRRSRGAPSAIWRLNHPVQPNCWDRQKPVRGWVASDRPVRTVALRRAPDACVTAVLEPRPDVEWRLGMHYAFQTGFRFDTPLGVWVDAGATEWDLVLTLSDDRQVSGRIRVEWDRDQRMARLERFLPLLRCPHCHAALSRSGNRLCCPDAAHSFPLTAGVPDFLPKTAAEDFGVTECENISQWEYDARIGDMIAACPEGVFLDCGAGLRDRLRPNVLNFEIVPYASTDVLGVAEEMPFADNVFDGVVCVGVLEHVRDPFRCAAEIVRVLKPGATLFCSVPFLQAVHGYPHHYYNMTGEGLRRLFPGLEAHCLTVPLSLHPIQALRWLIHAYAGGLPDRERRRFEQMRMRDVMSLPRFESMNETAFPVVHRLDSATRFEAAFGTCLTARKPEEPT